MALVDPEARKEYNRRYYAARKKEFASYARKYREEKPEVQATYRRVHSDKHCYNSAMYRARKKRACPSWLSDTQLSEIVNMYTKAKDRGLHVDHIVPLGGENVCGLHVPWNLQLLEKRENQSKNNSYDDWFNHYHPKRM